MSRNRNTCAPGAWRKWPFVAVIYDRRAFTLLEVMIAIAIMAIAFTSLLGSQSQSLSLAIEARFNATASLLAQEKVAEYEAGVAGLVSDEGDFGDDFPGFTWKTEVQEANLGEFEGLDELDQPVQRIDLTISWEGDQFSTTLTYYGREARAQ